MKTSDHYWILATSKEQGREFAKQNDIALKDCTFIHHPHQFRRFSNKTLIVLKEVFTKKKLDPIRIELIPLKKKNMVIELWSTDKLNKGA